MVNMFFQCLILTLVLKDVIGFPCLPDESKKKFDVYRKMIKDIKDDLSKRLMKLDSGLGTLVTDFKKGQWQKYNGHCYFYGTQEVSWFTAERRCKEIGGHLAKIDDTAENKWIFDTRPTNKINYWIGLHDLKEGEFRWTYDQTLTKIKLFHSGYGRKGTDANCVMLSGGNYYDWHDYTCNFKCRYVCESHFCY